MWQMARLSSWLFIPSGNLTVRHGKWPIEIDGPFIDGLPFLIAWWIFPWRTVSHNQRVYVFIGFIDSTRPGTAGIIPSRERHPTKHWKVCCSIFPVLNEQFFCAKTDFFCDKTEFVCAQTNKFLVLMNIFGWYRERGAGLEITIRNPWKASFPQQQISEVMAICRIPKKCSSKIGFAAHVIPGSSKIKLSGHWEHMCWRRLKMEWMHPMWMECKQEKLRCGYVWKQIISKLDGWSCFPNYNGNFWTKCMPVVLTSPYHHFGKPGVGSNLIQFSIGSNLSIIICIYLNLYLINGYIHICLIL